MSYNLRFGCNEGRKAYNVIKEYRVAVGGHRALKKMAWAGIAIYAIVQLNAADLEPGSGPVEDEVEYMRRIISDEGDGENDDVRMVPRLRIDIDDDDEEDDPRTHIGEHFDRIFEFVSRHQPYSDAVVLFQCWAGVSRSATACCAYLMRDFRLTVDRALLPILRERSVDPNPWFRRQLQTWEGELLKRFAERKRKTEAQRGHGGGK